MRIRQPYYFNERYVKTEGFSISFFFTMCSTYISSGKSGSENVA
ncbi:Acetyl-CoA acetyltransferase [Bacillus cereus Rock4-18]|nr:Acetyl-CoA acetyltransferase [Bacillus cereus Rock4-18]